MNYDELHALWREPVRFEIDVLAVASACRANHKKGEKFVFSWNTPEGLCGEAFVGMYPLLFSLRVDGDMTLLGAEEKNKRVYTCPSRVVKFAITAVEQCPLCGTKGPLEKCDIPVGERFHRLTICPECRDKWT